ncbi:MAG: hypothetical protein HYR84_07205, partial [Planctomycetes bacterium]|nr:hypothetical protein [Planctomycetota bacterium]
MATPELQPVADSVLRRAKQHGYVTPGDVRSELRVAGLAESSWKEVVAILHSSLVRR